MPVSKTTTLVVAVTLLLIVSMMTCIILQLLAGHSALELGVYAQGLFVYNGFYFGMLCVLAVVVQVVSPGKWSGMLLLFSLRDCAPEHGTARTGAPALRLPHSVSSCTRT